MLYTKKPKLFQCVAYSIQGCRQANEDNYLLIQNHIEQLHAQYLHKGEAYSTALSKWRLDKLRVAVADGMGGHLNGQQASESLIRYLLQAPAADSVSQLAAHIKTIHKKLLENFSGTGKNRPGSTLIMADIDVLSGLAIIANVGDSRAYLLRGGRLYQLSHDHSYCEFAWRDGDSKESDYFSNRQNPDHHLTQAMGFGSYGIVRSADGSRPYQYNPNLRLDFKDDGQTWQPEWDNSRTQHRDVFLLQLLEDDVLLLASDGLWSTGMNSAWTPEMTQPLTDVSALEKLVQTALTQGSQDNITLVMCAREGATGGYNRLDSTSERFYLDSKNLLAKLQQLLVQPIVNQAKNINTVALKPSLFLAGLVLFWLVVAIRLLYLHTQTSIVNTQVSHHSEDQQLFEKLQHRFLLETDAQKRLILKAPDYALAQQTNGTPLAAQDAKLLSDVYNSIAGDVVRRQIEIWNQTREFTALRDTSEVKWQVLDSNGLKPASGDTVPEAFGFVHQKRLNAHYSYGALRTEFNDWQVAQHAGIATYQRTIASGDKVHSQYIGQLQTCRVTIAGQPAQDCQHFIQPLCKLGSGLTPIATCNLTTATAGEIITPRFPAQASLAISMAAVANPIDKVNGLAISYPCKKNCPPTVELQNFTYQAEKTLTPTHQDVADSHFTIQTADGVWLTNALGTVSETAEELGLLGLIGTDKNDVGRLSYLMAKSHFADNYRLYLTLDSRIQRVAQQVLNNGINNLAKDAYQPIRRGAIVIVDTDNGDILASASFPQPPSGVDWSKKVWDKAVFSSRYAQLDPFLNRAWQGGDANQAPGSTFKVLMALAAAQRIKELAQDPAVQILHRYVTGLSPAQFTQTTGLNLSTYQLPVFDNAYLNKGMAQFFINNFRTAGGTYETMADFYNKPLTAHNCQASAVFKNRLSVAEALRDSSNVWFAQLAKILDGEAAQYHDLYNQNGELDLYLTRFLSRFGFADNFSLLSAGDSLSAKQQALWANAALLKTPVKNKYNLPPLLISKTDALMNLTQTAIGQSLYVTPLDMAQVATLAATGLWLKPTLIKQWQDNDRVVPIDKLELDNEIKRLIYAGLAAVVQVGTAEKAFAHHPDRCRVYGKTGTAQIGLHGKTLAPYNTAWFIGWREPKAAAKNTAANPEKKLAFACMVTHTAKTETGGSICAPLIANFFSGLNSATIQPVKGKP